MLNKLPFKLSFSFLLNSNNFNSFFINEYLIYKNLFQSHQIKRKIIFYMRYHLMSKQYIKIKRINNFIYYINKNLFSKSTKRLMKKIKFKKLMLNVKKLIYLKNKNLVFLEKEVYADKINTNIITYGNLISMFYLFPNNSIQRFRSLSYKSLQTYFNYINILYFLMNKIKTSLLNNEISLFKSDIHILKTNKQNKNPFDDKDSYFVLHSLFLNLNNFKFNMFKNYLNLIVKYSYMNLLSFKFIKTKDTFLHNLNNENIIPSSNYIQSHFLKTNGLFNFLKPFMFSFFSNPNIVNNMKLTENYYYNLSSNLSSNLFNYKLNNSMDQIVNEELLDIFSNLKLNTFENSFLQQTYIKELIHKSKNNVLQLLNDTSLMNSNLFNIFDFNENSFLYGDVHIDDNSDEVSSASLGLIWIL